MTADAGEARQDTRSLFAIVRGFRGDATLCRCCGAGASFFSLETRFFEPDAAPDGKKLRPENLCRATASRSSSPHARRRAYVRRSVSLLGDRGRHGGTGRHPRLLPDLQRGGRCAAAQRSRGARTTSGGWSRPAVDMGCRPRNRLRRRGGRPAGGARRGGHDPDWLTVRAASAAARRGAACRVRPADQHDSRRLDGDVEVRPDPNTVSHGSALRQVHPRHSRSVSGAMGRGGRGGGRGGGGGRVAGIPWP